MVRAAVLRRCCRPLGRGGLAGYDAAVRSRRLSLTLMLVATTVVGGCALGLKPTGALPPAFIAYLNDASVTFTIEAPPAGVVRGDELAAVLQTRAGAARLNRLQAVPVYGILRCLPDYDCALGPGAVFGEHERSVWVLFYPDLVGYGGRRGGWVIVDALTGLESGFEVSAP